MSVRRFDGPRVLSQEGEVLSDSANIARIIYNLGTIEEFVDFRSSRFPEFPIEKYRAALSFSQRIQRRTIKFVDLFQDDTRIIN